MRNKHDIERAMKNEAAFASINQPRHRSGKKPGELPSVTREATGAWHWWARVKVRLADGVEQFVHREGLASSKREACNQRRLVLGSPLPSAASA